MSVFPQIFLPEHQKLKECRPELAAKNLPSILGPIGKTFKLSLLGAFFLKLCFDLMQFVSPMLLKLLIKFMEDRSKPIGYGIAIATTMLISAYLQSMVLHQYFHIMFRMGMNIRSVLTGAVYRKALNLSNDARKNRSIGTIVNIMAVDIQRIQDVTSFIMLLWSSPQQIIIAVFFLYRELGAAVFAGLAVLVIMLIVNYFISTFVKNIQDEQMKLKDQRIKIMQEILNGIKVVKLYAWEKKMMNMVDDIRKKELITLRKLAYLNAATTLSWAIAPFLVAVLTFGIYVLIDPENNVLTPQVTFVSLALFNILRFPLAALGIVIPQVVNTKVSVNRLNEFFAEEEIKPEELGRLESSKADAVRLKEATFAWGAKELNPTLNDVDFTAKRGQLVAIVGRVGSGKSSLLQAILGEMNRISGERLVSGSAAYVPQQAWIRNQTLRQNILFNKPMERDFYELVIDACALPPDIAHLPGGDQTEIGEKGINLSGGQKQRISLARAVYANTDIILLDDPLSAVDAHVGKHIFENVISSKTGMLKDKTRIFVTHGLAFLKHCDQIIVMKDGKICESGGYNELLSQQGAFSDLIEEFLIEEAKGRGRSVSFGEDAKDVTEILDHIDKVNPNKRKALESQISQEITNQRRSSNVSPTPASPKGESIPMTDVKKAATAAVAINGAVAEGNSEPQNAVPLKNEEKQALLESGPAKPAPNKSKIIEKEAVQTGKVDWAVYLAYFKAIGMPITLAFVLIYIASSIAGVFGNLYLAWWSDDAKRIVDEDPSGHETYVKLGTYSALGMAQATTICLASIVMTLGMVRASKYLHTGILKNVLHSPMQFFDVTPLGRIINRFSKDVSDIDSRLPSFIINFFGSFLQSLMIMFIPIYVTPPILFFIVPTLVLYYYLCVWIFGHFLRTW
ncbi:hypothetical protein WR25_11795 isoform B [Diploscapter pachys]|uniref:ABC transmembrane type-1 domain-containing protein n=1 Tax=Diploscapter pachys TaxID=2018661 RepID=A0A2A2J948_9BILA|nr:hypothetical protein WR25_11795 isoform B [Diploscapter pachys]